MNMHVSLAAFDLTVCLIHITLQLYLDPIERVPFSISDYSILQVN